MVDVAITSVDKVTNTASVSLGNLSLSLPARGLSEGEAKLAVRPNRVRLSRSSGTTSNLPSLSGQVVKAIYVGSHMEYLVSTDYGEWFAVSDEVDQPLNVNEAVNVSFTEHGPVLLDASS